jgi:molybdate transport system regulatory protein
VWLERDGRFVMGDGGLRLMLSVQKHGSLTLAAREVGWSYRHAWEYIRRAERVLGAALTGAVPGKGTNRGTALTLYGVNILERLVALRERVDAAAGATGPTPEEIALRGKNSSTVRRARRDRVDRRVTG